MLPFLFTTLKRHLGTEDTKWWSVSGVILSHSSCKQVLRWATVRGLRCRILRFKMRHTFSIGDRSGLQPGQSSTRTLCLRSQDFVMCAECGFALSCWNMHGCPWKRCLLEGSILCSLNVLFSINGAITEVQVTFAKGTDTTPYHDRPWLLDLLLVTVWMILFFFGPEHTASIPPKKYLKYWFIWPQYTFPLCDGPSQMPPSPEKSTALLDTVNIASFWHSTVLTGICGCNYVLWYLTKVCQSSPEPIWWYRL